MAGVGGWVGVMLVCLCAAAPPEIRVNGQPLKAEAWQFLLLTRGVSDADAGQLRQLEDQAIERELIRQFLTERNVVAPPELVELRYHELERYVRKNGSEPEEVLSRLGLSIAQVKQELALSAAWETYIEQVVTIEQLRKDFEAHRAEYDGTRVRVRQIFRKATTPEARTAAEAALKAIQAQIAAGGTTFADAAQQHSEAPSRAAGGDVGWIVGIGQLPPTVSRAALALPLNEVSAPIVSPFGVHLVQVTERQPGQLSLEDVRPQLLERIAAERWRETVAQRRSLVRIERPAPVR